MKPKQCDNISQAWWRLASRS